MTQGRQSYGRDQEEDADKVDAPRRGAPGCRPQGEIRSQAEIGCQGEVGSPEEVSPEVSAQAEISPAAEAGRSGEIGARCEDGAEDREEGRPAHQAQSGIGRAARPKGDQKDRPQGEAQGERRCRPASRYAASERRSGRGRDGGEAGNPQRADPSRRLIVLPHGVRGVDCDGASDLL